MKNMKNKDTGCLLGLAAGDALGAAVEFMSLEQIKDTYGASGIQDFDRWGDFGAGSYTDDTQMAIATACGLIQSAKKVNKKELWAPVPYVYKEYIKWLKSQEDPSQMRRPGYTCLTALRSGNMGTLNKPINDSKGCGGVMRVAPVGLACDVDYAFNIGVQTAAITHGHPSGYLPSGFLAELIGYMAKDQDLQESIKKARQTLSFYGRHEETMEKVDEALQLAEKKEPIENGIEKLGQGWVGEEALAVSLFCSLIYEDDFSRAVKAAVNHSGDSDSTGAITGAIMGAKLGADAVPKNWVERLENAAYLQGLGEEMFSLFFK